MAKEERIWAPFLKSFAHGLWIDETLNFEGIVRSCFLNPRRKAFPDFTRDRGWIKFPLDVIHYSSDNFLDKIDPHLLSDFNTKKIQLHDPKHLWSNLSNNPKKQKVDKNFFIYTLKRSKWYGPYKHDLLESFYFFSMTDSGNNEMYVTLEVRLLENHEIILSKRSHISFIAAEQVFKGKKVKITKN